MRDCGVSLDPAEERCEPMEPLDGWDTDAVFEDWLWDDFARLLDSKAASRRLCCCAESDGSPEDRLLKLRLACSEEGL